MSKRNNFFGSVSASSPDFVMDIDTRNLSTGSTAANQFELHLRSTGTYNFVVQWGDGNQDTITVYNQAEVVHTYALEGTYTVTMTGILTDWRVGNTDDRLKILDITNWGSPQYTLLEFRGCENMQITATDGPDLTNCVSLQRLFRDCKALNTPNLGTNWNTITITNFREVFYGTDNFNQPVTWNTENGTNFIQTFRLALVFNSNIPWNMRSATSILAMFRQAPRINHPSIGNWTFTVINTIRQAFVDATDFNVDIRNWTLGTCTNISNCLEDTAFDQNIGLWDMSALVTGSNFMLGNTVLSTANYDLILTGWLGWVAGAPTRTLTTNQSLNFGDATFSLGTDAADAHNYLLTTLNWTIVDGGGV